MREGAAEHLAMCWGDIELKTAADGSQYLEKVIERQTKTRQGHDPRNTRESTPKAFSRSDNRCPVAAYKMYRDNRPVDMCKKDDPFYLGTTFKPQPGQLWFRRQRLGPDKLSKLMKEMKQVAKLDSSKRFTNTSLRKYLVQTLSDKNYAPTMIQQVTGHRSIQSINSYSKINEKQQEMISNALLAPNTCATVSRQQIVSAHPRCAHLLTTSTSGSATVSQQQIACIESRQPAENTAINLFAGAHIHGGTIQIFMDGQSHSSAKNQKIETQSSYLCERSSSDLASTEGPI
jgi:hypothetical protein